MKVKKESLIICDTNICIYRTLREIDPPIYDETLDNVRDFIQTLTNTNFRCKLIITDITIGELKNNAILFREIFKFCTEKLHLGRNSYQIQKITRKAEKSLNKFIGKKMIERGVLNKIKNYKKNLKKVDQFYLKYPKKLKELNTIKIKNLSGFDKKIKLKKRPNNLPEIEDRLLLCQVLELKKFYDKDIHIFSEDGDFVKFKEEICNEFGVGILTLTDEISLEEE